MDNTIEFKNGSIMKAIGTLDKYTRSKRGNAQILDMKNEQNYSRNGRIFKCSSCGKKMNLADWHECSVCIKCICDGIQKTEQELGRKIK